MAVLAASQRLREGLQDSEARIFIERSLLDEAQRATLGDGLARRAQQMLDERTRVLANRHRTEPWFFCDGYYERSGRLLGMAAEVTEALKSP
jgi:hypothetical protein